MSDLPGVTATLAASATMEVPKIGRKRPMVISGGLMGVSLIMVSPFAFSGAARSGSINEALQRLYKTPVLTSSINTSTPSQPISPSTLSPTGSSPSSALSYTPTHQKPSPRPIEAVRVVH